MSSMLACSTSHSMFSCGSNRLALRQSPGSAGVARRPLIVQAKLSKAADFRNLSQEEIMAQVETGKRDLLDLRCRQKSRQEMKTSDFTKIKLKIAQLLTVSREKEIANGETNRRAWRRKQKQRNIAAGFPQF